VRENDVTSPQVTGSAPKVTSFDQKSSGSGCRRPKTRVFCTFHFLQGCTSQEEAVTLQEMTSRDLRRPKVTMKWRHLTGSILEVAVKGQKLSHRVHFIFYKAVACRRRQSRDREWRHVTSGDWKCPEVTSFDRNSTWSGCRRSKTRVYCTFHFLQGCSSQEEAVTWQEMTLETSGDQKWPGIHVIWSELTLKGL